MNMIRTTLDVPLPDPVSRNQFSEFITLTVLKTNKETFNFELDGVEVVFDRWEGSQDELSGESKKVIRFSYSLLSSMPRRLSRYLFLHALAHLEYPDHCQEFFLAIERFEPNYRILEKQLAVYFEEIPEEHLPKCLSHYSTGGRQIKQYQGFSSVDRNSGRMIANSRLKDRDHTNIVREDNRIELVEL